MKDRDAQLAQTMETLDRLVSWATALKRRPMLPGLTVHQAGVLHLCIQVGPMYLDQLGALLGSAPSTITAVVGRLEAKGLVRRSRDADDGRRVWVTTTPAGVDQYTEIAARSEHYMRRLFAGWTTDEVRAFHALLERIVEDAQGLEFEPPASSGGQT
ncbi:MAG: MarR family transcriptional regulator [Alphaproteobacteria bacterium]|nr:MarR family transcriptional regulator [Alphaproteobacteria bacterium]